MDQNGKVIYEKEGYCEDKFLIRTDTLPEITKTGYVFDGWYETETFEGNPVTLQDPDAREGYTFRCWTLNKNAIEPVTVITPAEESIVVYAVWDPVSYSLTWKLDNGQAPEGVTYPNTYSVEILPFQPAAPVRQGYEFTGWKVTDADGAEVSLTDGKVPAGTIGNLILCLTKRLVENTQLFSTSLLQYFRFS